MKSCLKLAGLGAALATTAVQAEVKINENLSLDGYVIGAGVVTEGTLAKNDSFGKSGSSVFDAAYIAFNASYKDFSSKVSLLSISPYDERTEDTGILDAYVTYKVGSLALTGGKFLGWLGYESFHSPNNAFISFSQAYYNSPFSTGVKADYAGEGFSAGVSVRDSQMGDFDGRHFQSGDGDFGDDVGYEAYVLVSSIEKLTLFAGLGSQYVDEIGDSYLTYDLWASYALTDKVSVAAEYAFTEDINNGSWLLQSTYAASESLSISGRVTGADADNDGSDAFGYGLASTYTITPNFSVKGEVTKTDFNAAKGDQFQYALQGLFRF